MGAIRGRPLRPEMVVGASSITPYTMDKLLRQDKPGLNAHIQLWSKKHGAGPSGKALSFPHISPVSEHYTQSPFTSGITQYYAPAGPIFWSQKQVIPCFQAHVRGLTEST